ncbi:MAG: 30S ribosomal protein S13 [Candidatus Pacebacteria bacterium]|jgi:small subunit ribosomal protein S13|nr:30S ribosomal protein S13 [Candidatus Paceibacterota bacterium]
MLRILGVNLPEEKRIEIALTYLKGIGLHRSQIILESVGISPDKRGKEITSEEVSKIQKFIEGNYKVEGELNRILMMNIKRLKEIGAYRGTRHAKGLPARGQRTKTNSRTVRGNVRKTAGSGKRKVEKT